MVCDPLEKGEYLFNKTRKIDILWRIKLARIKHFNQTYVDKPILWLVLKASITIHDKIYKIEMPPSFLDNIII